MKMIYNVEDKLSFKQTLVYSLQQFLAVVCATILVPILSSGNGVNMSPAAALFGAGIATLFYVWVTKKKSPMFIGSSFAFISALIGATQYGWWGIILGGIFAGAVYCILAFIVWKKGTEWINKLMPAVIIGPTVALIGLGLSGSAIGNLTTASGSGQSYNLVAILCGLFAFFVTVFVSCKGSKKMQLMPFIIGIGAGYLLASFFSIFGYACNVEYLKIVNWTPLVENFVKDGKFTGVTAFLDYPHLAIIEAIKESVNGTARLTGAGVGAIALLFIPVSLVVFAEHIADHKNMSTIIEKDLLKDPGLHRTLIGDGFGTTVGTIFGCCPNTTYGECIGCVAITKNASIYTIIGAAVIAIIIAFFSPFIALIETIPTCILGGVCLALYGFIAVSGLKMLQNVDLGESKNLFVVSAILITGIGGLALKFGLATQGKAIITITNIATALIVGILTNVLLSIKTKKEKQGEAKDGESIAVVGEGVTYDTDDKLPGVRKDEVVADSEAVDEAVEELGLEEITRDDLVVAGLVRASAPLVKILGNGELTKKVVVKADKFSETAVKKIEAAGGKAVVNAPAEEAK